MPLPDKRCLHRRKGMSPKERKKMVSKRVDISLSRQCKIPKIGRSALYYTPVGFSTETLGLMRQIDKVFTQYPFFGSRQIAAYLPRKGYHAGRHRIRRLMKLWDWRRYTSAPTPVKSIPRTGFSPPHFEEKVETGRTSSQQGG